MKLLSSTCVALFACACASAPAAPFDTMPTSNVTVYRLQNFEPPAPVAAPTTPGLPQIPGVPIPPEIQQWANQALPGLQQMIPPGLLPPGLIPGMPAAAPPPAQAQAPRFHGFRILEQQPVLSEDLKEELAELLGTEDSFSAPQSSCMYAEMGLSFSSSAGAPPNDVLISYSCNQVQAHNFIWPHPTTGMTPETQQALSKIVPKLFPAGSAPASPQPVSML